VNLSPNEIRAAYYAVSTCRRALVGRRVPPSLLALSQRLEEVLTGTAVVTRPRQSNDAVTGESEPVNVMEFVGTRMAAEMLGVSLSSVLRRTDVLDGRMVGKQWVFPALAVERYRGELDGDNEEESERG